MPTYQYACTADGCGHQFEAFQSFTDEALTECPVCSGRVRKVFNSVGVVFKGSGFYRTDSREAAKKKQKDDKGSDAAKKKTDGKTDRPAGDKGAAQPSGDKSSTSSTPSSSTGKSSGSAA